VQAVEGLFSRQEAAKTVLVNEAFGNSATRSPAPATIPRFGSVPAREGLELRRPDPQ